MQNAPSNTTTDGCYSHVPTNLSKHCIKAHLLPDVILHKPIMKEESLDFHEKENHRGRHLDFDIRYVASKTAGNPFLQILALFSLLMLNSSPSFPKGKIIS